MEYKVLVSRTYTVSFELSLLGFCTHVNVEVESEYLITGTCKSIHNLKKKLLKILLTWRVTSRFYIVTVLIIVLHCACDKYS